MTLPPLRTRFDIAPFAEHLLAAPELWDLVSSFETDGLRQRRHDLATAILGGEFRDPAAPDPYDAPSHAGRVLSNWTLIDDEAAPAPMPDAPVAARLAWLTRFAAARWDFRLGRERDFIPAHAEMLAPDLAATVYSLAHRWGMRSPQSAHGYFDHVIVLGGLLRTNFIRATAAAEMLTSGAVTTNSVIGLGAPRPLSQAEQAMGQSIGCPATTEQAALEAGLGRVSIG